MITSASNTSPTLVQRKKYVWVYPHSDRKFTDKIPEGETLVYEQDSKGNAKSVTFNDSNGSPIYLECIEVSTLNKRKSHWVLLGTDNEYKGKITAEDLQLAKKDKNGNPKFITIKTERGTEINLECITTNILTSRKSHWVLLGTNIKYKDNISLEALMSGEKDTDGNLKFINIKNASGTQVNLERITAQILKSRKSQSALPSTNKKLTDNTLVKALRPAKAAKYGKSISAPKDVGGTAVRLNGTTTGKLKKIKSHWVLFGTDKEYQSDIPVEALEAAIKDKNGKPKFITIKDTNDTDIQLECITYKTLKDRKPQWVMLGTNNKYTGSIPAEALEAAKKDKNGNPKYLSITDDTGNKIHLECITASTLVDRKPHWVLPGTNKEYKGDIPQGALLLANKDKNGNPKFVTFSNESGTELRLECITADALKHRKPHWVWPSTDKKYQGDIPAGALEAATIDIDGNPKLVTFKDPSGTDICLESVVSGTLADRKRHWVFPGTDKDYKGSIPAEALQLAKKDKNGNPKFVTFTNESGADIHLESITARTLKRRAISSQQAACSPFEVLAEHLSQPPENASLNQSPINSSTESSNAQHGLPLTPFFTQRRYEATSFVWVYQDSCTRYIGDLPGQQSWVDCVRDDNGHLVSIIYSEQDREDIIMLEKITTETLAERSDSAQQCLDIASLNKQSVYQSPSPGSSEPPLKRRKF
jgi:hypothetical protein